MNKKFAVFDIDGTIFRSGLYREVVFELLAKNHIPNSIVSDFKDLEIDWKKRQSESAFSDYEKAMAEAVDKVLPSVRIKDFEKASKRVFERLGDYVYVYTRSLLSDLKEQGYTLIAISGSQEELVEPFAKRYGFDIWVGQQYERGDEYFTGKVIYTHSNKDTVLKTITTKHNLSYAGSIGIGDTKGDISMLATVEQPIAFNPDKMLFLAARKNGWKIVLERKNMIYELNPHGQSYLLD